MIGNLANKWEYFSKKTVGGQFVEAADPIAANIAERYGRQLILNEEHDVLIKKLKTLHSKINNYIKELKRQADPNISIPK